MPGPLRSAEGPSERALSTEGPVRSAGSTSRERTGTSCCATTIPATSAAGLQGQSAASARERAHEEELRAQVGPRRAGSPDRADALRTLWADDAVFYGQAKGHAHRYQCRATMPMWGRDVHWHWRLADRSRRCLADPGGGVQPCRSRRCLRPIRSPITQEIAAAIERELEAARYQASLLYVDTSSWIQPNAMWPASWKPAGTAHWSA